MALLKTAWANLQDGLGNRFSWSHVKAIFYNYAEHKLLSTKLDEMDALIDAKIAKAMMSSVQVNDESKVPTSALAYSMSQEISQNEQNIAQLNSKLVSVKRNLTWQSTVSEIGTSYSLRFGNWVYIHAGFITVSGLSNGNDLTMLIDSGTMQVTPNISAISDKGEIGVFRISETNLQAGGTIPSGQTFVFDFAMPHENHQLLHRHPPGNHIARKRPSEPVRMHICYCSLSAQLFEQVLHSRDGHSCMRRFCTHK